MREKQKKIVEEFVATLFEANDEIDKLIVRGERAQALGLLGECQQCALQVGTIIEDSEGEGFITVELLEAYCEMVYHLYEAIAGQAQVNHGKEIKRLRKQLIRIETSVKNDVTVRREAVFLPYKASMWDALESVWKAADEDEECDAYVIPIPYYDRKADGSFGEMHYEGDQLPDYVPVTHYEKFNFEEHHPELIFIHNPYDDMNLVTSVHPFFYSKNLKNFTERLVYIPYFVWAEIKPDNEKAIAKMRHFCTTPGVLNADKVIVQSEDMRQIYINVLSEEMGEQTRPVWEEKILGLGSPKLDKVTGTDPDDVEIPDEWRRIIERPDGSRKKIILYNTSITALLEKSEAMIEKMKDVFRFFKEVQDEVAFLWRPHPLIPATIESMRPQLWKEYKKLMDDFRAEGWGIYDDTPDVDRAVLISDGYYGDGSSVTVLYRQTGKPVMIQDVDILTGESGAGNR